jgi:hypothetical protein
METDDKQNNPTDKAELALGQEQQPKDEIVVATAQTEAKDFSAPPSQDNAARGEQEEDTHARGQLGQESAPGADSGPGFVDVNGDVGGSGHNETEVDIIAVPCPGADPVHTWTWDEESCGEASVSFEIGSRISARKPSQWITRDLRKAASIARVFLYRHRALEEGMTLQSLAKDLLGQVRQIRSEGVGALACLLLNSPC